MDELEISGKRYISSRRAAKQYKYHSDYIGQLIRGGKVIGTKVGRSWYVETKSLAAYLGQEEVPQSVGEAYQAPGVPGGVVYIGRAPVQEKKIEREPGEVIYVAEKISIPHIVPIHTARLTYVPDTEPLLPEIRSAARTFETDQLALVTEKEPQPMFKKKARSKRSGRRFFLPLAIVGVVGICLIALGANFIASSIVVEEGRPAAVIYFLK